AGRFNRSRHHGVIAFVSCPNLRVTPRQEVCDDRNRESSRAQIGRLAASAAIVSTRARRLNSSARSDRNPRLSAAMPTLLIEEDHFLKIVPVILDPATPPAHVRAVADFFAHDVPDFSGWVEQLRARIPGLFPTSVVWAQDQADFLAKLPAADGAIVESFVVDRGALAAAPRLKIVQKFGTL